MAGFYSRQVPDSLAWTHLTYTRIQVFLRSSDLRSFFFDPFIYLPWDPRTLQVSTWKNAIFCTQETPLEDLIILSHRMGCWVRSWIFPQLLFIPLSTLFWDHMGDKLLWGSTFLQVLSYRALECIFTCSWCLWNSPTNIHDCAKTHSWVIGIWVADLHYHELLSNLSFHCV